MYKSDQREKNNRELYSNKTVKNKYNVASQMNA